MAITNLITTLDFDSVLGATPDVKDNATDLTVVLKLEFIAIDAKTAKDISGREFKMRPWDDGDIRHYIETFKESVQRFWSDKIYILFPDPTKATLALPRSDYQRFLALGSNDKTPYLRCNLSIRDVDKNAHARVNMLNVEPGQGRFQARAFRHQNDRDTLTIGSDALTSHTQRSSAGDTYRQTSAFHEIGHLLDLDHINASHPDCKLDKNAEICYGGTPYEMNDIMGWGDAVTGDNAKTWLKAIRLHTRHEQGWVATHLSPPDRRLMQLP